jgi:hypothetical protein
MHVHKSIVLKNQRMVQRPEHNTDHCSPSNAGTCNPNAVMTWCAGTSQFPSIFLHVQELGHQYRPIATSQTRPSASRTQLQHATTWQSAFSTSAHSRSCTSLRRSVLTATGINIEVVCESIVWHRLSTVIRIILLTPEWLAGWLAGWLTYLLHEYLHHRQLLGCLDRFKCERSSKI